MNGRFPVIKPGARFHALTAQIWAQKLDFCVVQTRMYTQSVWAARAAKRRGIPMLVIDHSTGYMPMGSGLLGACGRLYEQIACRLVRGTRRAVLWRFRRCPAAGCTPLALRLQEPCPTPLTPLLWNRKPPTRQTGVPKLNLGDRKIVLFVGRLIPEKGARIISPGRGPASGRCSGGGWQRSAAAGTGGPWGRYPRCSAA